VNRNAPFAPPRWEDKEGRDLTQGRQKEKLKPTFKRIDPLKSTAAKEKGQKCTLFPESSALGSSKGTGFALFGSLSVITFFFLNKVSPVAKKE